jgi:hypothetical protein
VHGHGRAPSWRLTELPYKANPATRDFLSWNGAPFGPPKNRTPPPKTGTPRPRKRGQENGIFHSFPCPRKQGQEPVPENGDKSRIAFHKARGERRWER